MQYNQVAILRNDGYEITHFDEIINDFINEKFWCGVSLPPLTPRVGLPPRISSLSYQGEALRAEVFREMGMNPDGELLEEIEEKKKLKLKGKLFIKKKKKNGKKKEEQNNINEIEEENKLRAMLGLKPLH